MSASLAYTLVATAITFLIVGVWLVFMVATAAIARSEERMQKKVAHWQERAIQAEDPRWRRSI
ncbi:MAG TPA: hypothetical protein VGL93_14500 [Streptosporangiaceae bacterium]|jgi:large-conductance mechanosensitive channel